MRQLNLENEFSNFSLEMKCHSDEMDCDCDYFRKEKPKITDDL